MGKVIGLLQPGQELAVQILWGGDEEVVGPAAGVGFGGDVHPGGVQPTGQSQGEGELVVLPVPAAPGEGEGGKDVAVLQGDLGLLHLHLGFRQG